MSRLFFFALSFFVGQPSTLRSRSRASCHSSFRSAGDFENHRSQLFQALSDVATLIAVLMTGEDQVTGLADTVRKRSSKALLNAGRQRIGSDDIPAEDCFGVYFVYVLAAWTWRAGEREC